MLIVLMVESDFIRSSFSDTLVFYFFKELVWSYILAAMICASCSNLRFNPDVSKNQPESYEFVSDRTRTLM